MDALRIGLIGYGRFGRMHVKAISNVRDAILSSVCVASEKSLAEAKTELDVPIYRDLDEFLHKEALDAVDIVTPNYLHSIHAIAALSAGKDVLLEKPMAISVEEARRLVNSQRSSGKKVQIGFEYRYSEFWQALKKIINENRLGQPKWGKIDSWRFPFRPGSDGWKYDKSKVGHQLLEEAIHYVDLGCWYFSNPKALRVWGYSEDTDSFATGKLRSAFLMVEFDQNRRFLVTDTLTGFGSDLAISICGEEGAFAGAIRADSDDTKRKGWIKLKDREGVPTVSEVECSEQLVDLTKEISDFVSCVKYDADPSVSVEEGFLALAICEAAIRSMQTNSPEQVRSIIQ